MVQELQVQAAMTAMDVAACVATASSSQVNSLARSCTLIALVDGFRDARHRCAAGTIFFISISDSSWWTLILIVLDEYEVREAQGAAWSSCNDAFLAALAHGVIRLHGQTDPVVLDANRDDPHSRPAA